MDEYIKREDVISAMCFGCNQQFSDEPCEPNECALRQAIKAVPTADVVPKSEVDKTIAEWAWLHADTLNKLDNAKAEAAREIFAEIEENLTAKEPPIVEMDYFKFLELKDKYIPKDCRTCKHMLSCEPSVLGICDEYEEENRKEEAKDDL